jgi:hypothetical protein
LRSLKSKTLRLLLFGILWATFGCLGFCLGNFWVSGILWDFGVSAKSKTLKLFFPVGLWGRPATVHLRPCISWERARATLPALLRTIDNRESVRDPPPCSSAGRRVGAKMPVALRRPSPGPLIPSVRTETLKLFLFGVLWATLGCLEFWVSGGHSRTFGSPSSARALQKGPPLAVFAIDRPSLARAMRRRRRKGLPEPLGGWQQKAKIQDTQTFFVWGTL